MKHERQDSLPKQDQLIIHWAFRYALGRATVAPATVADYLFRRWHLFDQDMKDQIKKEIKEEIKRGKAGHDIDVRTWKRVLTFP